MKTAPKRVTQCEHEVYFLPLYYNDALDRHYSVSVLLMMCKLACSFVEYRFMDSTISSSSFSRTCTPREVIGVTTYTPTQYRA